MRRKSKSLFIGLALLIGGLSLSYTQPKYNVIKDPSFESDSEVWKEIAVPEDAASVDRHVSDPVAPDGKYVGVISATMGGKGTTIDPYHSGVAGLTQEFIPRIVSDFDLDNSLELWAKWIPSGDSGAYEWGIKISSIQGDTLSFRHPGKQDTWTHNQYGNIYEEWIRKGLPEKDSLYEIKLWATSRLEMKIRRVGWWPPRYETTYTVKGEAVGWDLVRLYSKRPDSDAGVLSIDSPDRMEEGYEPISTVENFGAVGISFPVICDISENEELVYSDTSQVDELTPDSTTQITFEKYTGTYSPAASYSIKCYTLLDGDQNPANDSLAKSLMTGILEKEKTKITSTIPTIFVREMTLHLPREVVTSQGLPKGSRATLYNINGRIVKELYDRGEKGKVTFGKNLAPGVYFLITSKGKEKLIKVK